MTLKASLARPPLVPLAALLMTSLCGACATGVRLSPDRDPCVLMDSLFARSGFGEEVILSGSATIDADQRRFRGRMAIKARPSGDIVAEFSGGVLFGAQREDFVFSLASDTLRILDRERGHYYEGDDASAYLRESLGLAFDVAGTVALALGGRPPCDALAGIEVRGGGSGEASVRGRHLGEPFQAVFGGAGGRLREVEWPVRFDGGERDRLRVRYDWAGGPANGPLREVVLGFEERPWRCRIISTTD